MRILLVEDDALNVEVFSAVFESDGHDFVVETDGLRGRDRALTEPFDLIVLDIHLPGMAGDAVCRELRSAGLDLPILALSAAALPAQVTRGMDAGFTAYLTKPITLAALRQALDRHRRAPGR